MILENFSDINCPAALKLTYLVLLKYRERVHVSGVYQTLLLPPVFNGSLENI